MSIHYIIDGYNVVKQVKFLTGQRLRAGREGLVSYIEKRRPQGSRKNRVTVVFDGKSEIEDHPQTSSVKVVFSKGMSADDKIKRMVEHSLRPSDMIVVTDDRAVIYYCRSAGARVKSVKEFLRGPASSPVKQDDRPDKPDPESRACREITGYLEKLWLDRDKDS